MAEIRQASMLTQPVLLHYGFSSGRVAEDSPRTFLCGVLCEVRDDGGDGRMEDGEPDGEAGNLCKELKIED